MNTMNRIKEVNTKVRISELGEMNTAILQRCYQKLPDSVALPYLKELLNSERAFLYEQYIPATEGTEEGKEEFIGELRKIDVEASREEGREEVVYVGIAIIAEYGLHAVVGASKSEYELNLDHFKQQLHFLQFMVMYLHQEGICTGWSNSRGERFVGIQLTGRYGWYLKYLKHLDFDEMKEFRSSNRRLCGTFLHRIRVSS